MKTKFTIVVMVLMLLIPIAQAQEPIEGILIGDVFYPCEGMTSLIEALERCVPASIGVWVDGQLYECPDEWLFTSPFDVTSHCASADIQPAHNQVVSLTAPPQTIEVRAEVVPIVYMVQPGDNLSGIARRFGITLDALIAVNQIENPDIIHSGNVLSIPQG